MGRAELVEARPTGSGRSSPDGNESCIYVKTLEPGLCSDTRLTIRTSAWIQGPLIVRKGRHDASYRTLHTIETVENTVATSMPCQVGTWEKGLPC